MPEYDAFGREVEPGRESVATAQASATPVPAAETPQPGPPARPARRRRSGPQRLVRRAHLVGIVIAVGIAAVTLSRGADDATRSLREARRSLPAITPPPVPDAPAVSALTGSGAVRAVRLLRTSGRPLLLALTGREATVTVRAGGGTRAVTLLPGDETPTRLSAQSGAPRAETFGWDAVRPAAVERMVRRAGGADRVTALILARDRAGLRWTIDRTRGRNLSAGLDGR